MKSTDHVLAQGMVNPGFAADRRIDLRQQRAVSYTHLRAHETVLDLVCRLLLEKKKYYRKTNWH